MWPSSSFWLSTESHSNVIRQLTHCAKWDHRNIRVFALGHVGKEGPDDKRNHAIHYGNTRTRPVANMCRSILIFVLWSFYRLVCGASVNTSTSFCGGVGLDRSGSCRTIECYRELN